MELPGIYKNQLEENLNNSQELFYSKTPSFILNEEFPYYAIIKTKNQTFEAKLVGKTTNYLVIADLLTAITKQSRDVLY